MELLEVKRENNLYDLLVNIKSLEGFYYEVRLTTKHREKISNFELFYMTNIGHLYRILKKKMYQHSAYNIFLIKEPKYRIVMSEVISDKIINHALSRLILLPFIEPLLLPMNVATREKLGIQAGFKYVKKYINSLKNKQENFYILKCDIVKYFYNIDHVVLYQKLSLVIKDEDVLNLLWEIITTTNKDITNKQIIALIENEKKRLRRINAPDLKYRLKELDKIPLYLHGKGIPIGNMSSQIFAIFFLNDMDHYIKEVLHIKCYVRYMDDFILLHEDKEYLHFCYQKIKDFLRLEKLELNEKKTKIFSIKQGLPFIGYRFILKNKKLIVLMNPKTKKKITKHLNYLTTHNVDEEYKRSCMASYYGYFLNCNCGAFLHKHGWYENEDFVIRNKRVSDEKMNELLLSCIMYSDEDLTDEGINKVQFKNYCDFIDNDF